MDKSINKYLKITRKGEEVFIEVLEPDINENIIPYGKITEYIKSLKIKDIDYSAVKKAYKNRTLGPVKFARYPIGEGYTSNFRLTVSKDQSVCNLVLLPPRENEKVTDLSMIKKVLKEKGIVYGIDEKMILNGINNKKFRVNLPVAVGKQPLPGKDSILMPKTKNDIFYELTTKLKDEELFYSYNFINKVSKGEELGRRAKETAGDKGVTVFGEKIPTIAGEETNYYGINIEFVDDKIISNIDGRVFFSETGVEVEELLVVNNLRNREVIHDGSIKILGDVESCPMVQASGDIEVHGIVNNTPMLAGRNIFVHESVMSKQSSIAAGSCFVGMSVSNSNITAENVYVFSTIFNSSVNAYRDVKTLSKNGRIVGGNVCAGSSIESIEIGNIANIQTTVSVSSPGFIGKYKEKMVNYYHRKIEILEKNKELLIIKLEKLYILKNQSGVIESSVYDRLIYTYKKKIENVDREISEQNLEIVKIKDPKYLMVEGDIKADLFYPNTVIEMGAGKRKIDDEKENVRYYLKEGNIVTEHIE